MVLREIGGDSRVLTIFIGGVEMHAIQLALEGHEPPRPMTHDLFRDVLDELGVLLERVVITELRESTFFAELHLTASGQARVVSSRPSDAVALAVRVGCRIFVAEEVLDEAATAPARGRRRRGGRAVPGVHRPGEPRGLRQLKLRAGRQTEATTQRAASSTEPWRSQTDGLRTVRTKVGSGDRIGVHPVVELLCPGLAEQSAIRLLEREVPGVERGQREATTYIARRAKARSEPSAGKPRRAAATVTDHAFNAKEFLAIRSITMFWISFRCSTLAVT